jgi:hypothetical protein
MAGKRRINIFAIIGFAMILIGLLYVITGTIMNLHYNWTFRLIFVAWVMLYMLLNDIVEPIAVERFKRKNRRQVRAYWIYAALDIIGVAGLLWFAVMAGMVKDPTHYAGIAIFAVCFVPRGVFYKKFNSRKTARERMEEQVNEEEDIELML